AGKTRLRRRRERQQGGNTERHQLPQHELPPRFPFPVCGTAFCDGPLHHRILRSHVQALCGGTIHPEMIGMAALVFVLGLRHGFDPDHLVAIDGLTRSTNSRWCGLFFSLGHGVAVTLIGVAVALAATEWQAPAWLEQTGAL